MSETAVYIGFWTNWSKGLVSGATLTTGHQHGFFLISFLTLFVRMVGAHGWSIIIFIVHHLKSTLEPMDGLHHQHQLILRNSQSHTSTLWNFTKVAFFWRNNTKNAVRRTLPLFILCLVHLVLFTAAAFFSSLIASTSDEVLVEAKPYCGYLPYPKATNFTVKDDLENIDVWRDSRVTAAFAADYVRDCYQDQLQTSTCDMFAQSQIPIYFEQVECPFAPEMCIDPAKGALRTVTHLINSDIHLGINSRPEDSVDYRRIMTCAPIVTKYRYTIYHGSTENITGDWSIQFDYGDYYSGDTVLNYTFSYSNYNKIFASSAYSLYHNFAAAGSYGNGSSFLPIPQLRDDSADLTLIFMVNLAQYSAPINDIFFRTWGEYEPWDGADAAAGAPTYQNAFPMAVMGCKEQHQVCIHNGECTPLTGVSKLGDLELFKGRQLAIAKHLYVALDASNLIQLIYNLDNRALQAESYVIAPTRLLSAPLPDDQWIREIQGWANFTGARLQRMMYQYAVGPTDPSLRDTVLHPSMRDVWDVCANQKIRDSHYYSFSVVGLVVTLVLGCAIVALNLCLSTVVSFIQGATGRGLHHRQAWRLDSNLQVQRMAYENAGMGAWKGKESLVPVTEDGGRFGMPIVGRASGSMTGYSPFESPYPGGSVVAPLMKGEFPFERAVGEEGGYHGLNLRGVA